MNNVRLTIDAYQGRMRAAAGPRCFPCSGIEMQSHKTRFKIIAALCFAITVGSAISYLGQPSEVPSGLKEASGPVQDVEATQRKMRLQSVRFTLKSNPSEFEYSSVLPNIDGLWHEMKVGDVAHVTYSGEQTDPELWGLELNGKAVVTPQGALQARRDNGQIGLYVGLAALLAAGYFFMRARRT
ncbi:hypothetical protein [Xanthomonas axonopodis]|uniref:hypothetical protein n=1 Tax=Xanthomonas axonopodis TaxID=53413 RepID=UPI0020C9C324|nr:hypothetical protein [Xanthomonas axonopodis]